MDELSTKDHPDWWTPVGGLNSEESTHERRSTIRNDTLIGAPDAPPLFYSGITMIGKFFPRGCRGKIHQLRIYCRGAVVDGIELSLSPHPDLGPLYTVNITPLAGWAWRGGDLVRMWNYDSLFIWVSACDVGCDWGYDEALLHDGHQSIDAGVTWPRVTRRPFILVWYDAETPGDVPVSGIINTIQLPNASSEVREEDVVLDAGVWAEVIRIEGAGYVDLLWAYVVPFPNSHLTYFEVECDGVIAWVQSLFFLDAHGFNDDTQPQSLPIYGVDDVCSLQLSKKWEFLRLFRVRAMNAAGGQTVNVFAHPNLLR